VKSKISIKLNGFIEKYEAIGEQPSKPKSALSNFLTEMQTPGTRRFVSNFVESYRAKACAQART